MRMAGLFLGCNLSLHGDQAKIKMPAATFRTSLNIATLLNEKALSPINRQQAVASQQRMAKSSFPTTKTASKGIPAY
ncbi:MAG TPA: hypothetical protein VGH23_00275 [Rhizomicrobium sp.]|jgi:hypothetical protein